MGAVLRIWEGKGAIVGAKVAVAVGHRASKKWADSCQLSSHEPSANSQFVQAARPGAAKDSKVLAEAYAPTLKAWQRARRIARTCVRNLLSSSHFGKVRGRCRVSF